MLYHKTNKQTLWVVFGYTAHELKMKLVVTILKSKGLHT